MWTKRRMWMWYHHWGDCGLHDWIIQFLMALGVLTHVRAPTHAQKPCEWVGGGLGPSNGRFWCLMLYSAALFLSSCPSQPFLLSVSLYQTPTWPHTHYFSPVWGDCKESPVFLHFTTSGSRTRPFERKRTHTKTFSKLHSKFVFISSTQAGLNLDRRNNIPTCCVKLYELMKSAG